jgi:hypothetical protein
VKRDKSRFKRLTTLLPFQDVTHPKVVAHSTVVQVGNLKIEKRDAVLEAVLAKSRREDLEARLRADRENVQMKQVLAQSKQGNTYADVC